MAYKGNKQMIFYDKICCPLPFPLQDLCLLAVVSHLDSYQVDHLASLPQQMRQRLLNILPALDLCRLEHTSVASGVDIDKIWKSRPAPSPEPTLTYPNNCFQLQICSSSKRLSYVKELMSEGLKSLFRNRTEPLYGKDIFFTAASDIFADCQPDDSSWNIGFGSAIQKLVSIKGKFVFPNLVCGSMHQSCCEMSQCEEKVWKNQITALKVQRTVHGMRYSMYGHYKDNVHLTPRYRQSILNECDDPLKVFSILAQECNLQPSSAFVDIDTIYDFAILERLALDCGSSLPSDELTWTTTLNQVLHKVSILKLECSKYSNFSVMTGLIEASLGYSQLKYLFCSMPDLYLDVVQLFLTLFSLQNFHQLALELKTLSPLMFCRLLHGFMTVSCEHEQKLTIDAGRDLALPTSLHSNQLASLYKGGSLPSSNAEYKVFQLSPKPSYTSCLYLLLQLPSIRLKMMTFKKCHDYFHLCAMHPDLQVTKLVLEVSKSLTIQKDLISILGLPSLQEIVICGQWGELDEVKVGIVQGLQGRSRSLPLKLIALRLASSCSYTLNDFQILCETIFALPDLKNLELVFGKGFADLIKQESFEDILYSSWICQSVRLKSICLQTRSTEFKYIKLMTHNLTFDEPGWPRFRK